MKDVLPFVLFCFLLFVVGFLLGSGYEKQNTIKALHQSEQIFNVAVCKMSACGYEINKSTLLSAGCME